MASGCSASLLFLLGLAYAASVYSAPIKETVDITWGGERAKFLNNGHLLTLSEDKESGSGFQSKKLYLYGELSMQMKLVPGDSAGTVTTFYMATRVGALNEIDFEFLGNLSGQPYTVHTNIYINGTGNREQQFSLWFDPSADFHNYTIVWNRRTVGWYVDGKAIRLFPNLNAYGIPYLAPVPMRMFSSIWNGDDWATMGGKVKTNWNNAPFTALYRNFNAVGCVISDDGASSCSNSNTRSIRRDRSKVSLKTRRQIRFFKKRYMIYNYCSDNWRFPAGMPPECKVKFHFIRGRG